MALCRVLRVPRGVRKGSARVKRWLGVSGLLAAASFAVWGSTLVSDRAFFYRDVLHYYWPTRLVANEAWRAGELPLWNRYSMAGVPLLADLHAAILYPPNLLALLMSFPRAYAWLLALHHVAGA